MDVVYFVTVRLFWKIIKAKICDTSDEYEVLNDFMSFGA